MKRIISSVLVLLILSSSYTFALNPDNKNVILSEEYIVNLIFKETGRQVDKDDLKEIKTLLDFTTNEYTLIELEKTGYLIFDNSTHVLSEYSFNGLSPYKNFDSNLYYLGPTQYYLKDGKGYRHTITNEIVSNNETIDQMKVLSLDIQTEFKNQKSLKK